VCHHRSETSSTKAFIDKVNPDYSIIQVGRNSYGHPSEITLKTLEDSKTEIYRNDINGCVKINDKIEVYSMESE
jgi:competence protein ComEC